MRGTVSGTVCTLAFVAGCAGSSESQFGGREVRTSEEEAIARLALLAFPSPVNLDERPGVDGFRTKVYATGLDYPKGILITGGCLEVLLFDGVVPSPVPADGVPRERWSYTPDQLRRHAFHSMTGIGYDLALRWDEKRPVRSVVTIIARYHPEDGAPVESSSVSLAVRVN